MTLGYIGQAGMGVNTTGILMMRLFASCGYCVYGDKEYQSRVKGGTNLFVVSVDDRYYRSRCRLDYLFVFDPSQQDSRTATYSAIHIIPLYDQSPSQPLNMFALGMSAKMLGFAREEVATVITEKFVTKPYFQKKNLTSAHAGREYGEVETLLERKKPRSQKVFFGNEILAQSAIQAGLKFYSAYPMTPASTLINAINNHNASCASQEESVTFFQGEDEIAVAMAMLGARFAGVPAMCATSGGGFALMSESISFAHQAELGGVYILSQRDGPSTGTPTFTAQGDLAFACNASFGDTKPIVIAPSNPQNARIIMQYALLRAQEYQHPVIVLVDKQFSEGYFTLSEDSLHLSLTKKLENKPLEEDLKMISSYEHDENGATTEDPAVKQKMTQKKQAKQKNFAHNALTDDCPGYEIINEQATTFFITFGSNEYALRAFVQQHKHYGAIIIHLMQPKIPGLQQRFDYHLPNIGHIYFLEMNYSGQFQDIIVHTYQLRDARSEKISHLRKWTLYPFFEKDVSQVE